MWGVTLPLLLHHTSSTLTEKGDWWRTGPLVDAKCDVEAVELANSRQLHSILSEIVNTTYFRLFRVKLDGECQFWRESVCEETCKLHPEPPMGAGTSMSMLWDPMTDQVDRSISTREDSALSKKDACDDDDKLPSFWLNLCDGIPTSASDYVNLQLNPEAWTGYNGSHIWEAIYNENCFSMLGVDQMCYEERVLYRLLSGMHSSINIHIALAFFPPKKGEPAGAWKPDPKRFMDQFGNHPERIRNLHFAFVVLLRALRKAAPFLYHYPFATGGVEEDAQTTLLMNRLLDSHILRSCEPVFSAFDESLLFRVVDDDGFTPNVEAGKGKVGESPMSLLKKQFKGVFQNISRVLDCVSCQKCKLHGKLALLGLGTALKILLVPDSVLASSLSSEELVALVNTMQKFSHAISSVEELSNLYWRTFNSYKEPPTVVTPEEAESSSSSSSSTAASDGKIEQLPPTSTEKVLDWTVGAIAQGAEAGSLTNDQENTLIDLALAGNPGLLALGRHYGKHPLRLLGHAVRNIKVLTNPTQQMQEALLYGERSGGGQIVDAVIVGGGLSGLIAALTIVDRGGRVVILEKEPFLGGNSAWASSGVNAVNLDGSEAAKGDSVDVFANDTLKSSGKYTTNSLITILSRMSGEGRKWLKDRAGVPLNHVSQLGGHSFPRTWRPSTGITGAELVFAISKILEGLAKDNSQNPRVKILKKSRATRLELSPDGDVVGVEYVTTTPSNSTEKATPVLLRTSTVILASGGFVNDRDKNDPESLLNKYRPDLVGLDTTNGRWTTGDGIKMAIKAGALTVDMDDIQVHPTAFVDPKEPNATMKVLCAELLRGVGALLIEPSTGERFCNELGYRDYIVAQMREAAGSRKATANKQLEFVLLLSSQQAALLDVHLPLYLRKGLLSKFNYLSEVEVWASLPRRSLPLTLHHYNNGATSNNDKFGKITFPNTPIDLQSGPWYAGKVTPALHYSIGGLVIDDQASVLREKDGKKEPIPGLYAVGEVTGGIHGKNRLAGNAMTECVVFGRLVGSHIPLPSLVTAASPSSSSQTTTSTSTTPTKKKQEELREINLTELAQHRNSSSCWVALYGQVYDLTEFLEEHPGGPRAVLEVGGVDGTKVFAAVHTQSMLVDFQPIGRLQTQTQTPTAAAKKEL